MPAEDIRESAEIGRIAFSGCEEINPRVDPDEVAKCFGCDSFICLLYGDCGKATKLGGRNIAGNLSYRWDKHWEAAGIGGEMNHR